MSFLAWNRISKMFFRGNYLSFLDIRKKDNWFVGPNTYINI